MTPIPKAQPQDGGLLAPNRASCLLAPTASSLPNPKSRGSRVFIPIPSRFLKSSKAGGHPESPPLKMQTAQPSLLPFPEMPPVKSLCSAGHPLPFPEPRNRAACLGGVWDPGILLRRQEAEAQAYPNAEPRVTLERLAPRSPGFSV